MDPEFDALRSLSAKVGSDPALVQGPGGNTSIKIGDTLWIKASGTWLRDARERDIFVPVALTPLRAAIEANAPSAEKAQEHVIAALNPSGLRPSIETTVHALLPRRIVVHVHCIETIAACVPLDAEARLAEPLRGFEWAFISYRRPGLPLARAILERLSPSTDVLVLGSHGLAVAADTVAEAEALLGAVCARLARAPRPTPSPDLAALERLAVGTGYRLPAFAETHATALDPVSLDHVRGGNLYPDHVIFLGPRVGLSDMSGDPVLVLCPDVGALIRADANPGAEALARCLADVTARIPAGTALRYLTDAENAELLNWDAEKYRQALNRAAQ